MQTTFRTGAFGMSQIADANIILAGGFRTGLPGTNGTARLRYSIYLAEAAAGGRPEEIGTAEVNLFLGESDEDVRVEGIVDLKIAKPLRGRGYGRKVVECLAELGDGGRLKVYDVKKSAIGFWQGLGFELSKKLGRLDGVAEFEGIEPRSSFAPMMG